MTRRRLQLWTAVCLLLMSACIAVSQLFEDYAAALWGVGLLFFAGAVVLVVKRANLENAGGNAPS